MKFIIALWLLICTTLAFGQKNEDNKIIINLNDSIGIYEKVKYALVNNDFMVKDNGNKDTLTTYPRELNNMPGYVILKAEINGNKIILYGSYGLIKINDWGYTVTPKNYQRIIYYKGSKTWKLMLQVANKLGGNTSYSK